MRVKLQLVICNDEGDEETVTDVLTLNKKHQRIEHLGLTLAEAKHLLSTLQRHLLQQQIDTFLDECTTCPDAVAQKSPCKGDRVIMGKTAPLKPRQDRLCWLMRRGQLHGLYSPSITLNPAIVALQGGEI